MRKYPRKKRTLLGRVGPALILLAIVCIVFFLYGPTSMAKSPNVSKQIKESGQLANLKIQIANYTNNYQGEYGVYYYDLTTGQEFGINDEDQFTSASCEKVPINLYLYQQIQSGAVNPETTLTYTQADYEDGTGSIQYQKVGTQYTIDELSKLSIVQSDNVATNMLIRFLGMPNIKNYMRQVGGQVVVDDQNVSSPSDMGLYMKLVYEFSENNRTLGDELLNDLLNTELYDDRLPALLPKSVKVAHKIGNEVGVINDVGIVFADKPYIVAVMSKGVNEKEAPAVIANISKMIYDSLSRQ
jgi:beta-lactamase class A